jgi:hypothetical protein
VRLVRATKSLRVGEVRREMGRSDESDPWERETENVRGTGERRRERKGYGALNAQREREDLP